MKEKILCLFKEPFKDPVRIEVENDFLAIQRQVGCETFQCLNPLHNIMFFIDDEGKFKKGAQPNVRYGTDIIVGNILVAGIDGEDNVSLSDRQIDIVTRCLNRNAFTRNEAVHVNLKDYMGFAFFSFGGGKDAE